MATPRNPLEAFVWGAGGAPMTPEEIAKQREIEEALVARGVDTSPVGHWTQGLARVADAFAGSVRRGRLNREAGENADYNEELLSGLLGGSRSGSSVPMTSASGEVAATSPVQPVDMTGNEIFTGFMDTIRSGGVTNPYALAAIAATGKRESGFSPGNVNRTWSDPSESGQAGTAGGIMSWRGPRYQALAATGDLSPAGQARFFLKEDPQLITALQNARSVEEAQTLMNKAWRFAGYNRPGGETAARFAAAKAFLPTFQQAVAAGATPAQAEQIATTEVASLDPSAGMETPEAAIEAIAPVNAEPSLSDEFADSQQLQNGLAAQAGIVSALTGGTPADPAQIERARSQPVQQVAQAMAAQPQQSQGVGRQALLRALSDPRATPQTRAVVQALMQQEFAREQAEREQQVWMQRQQYEQQQRSADPAYQLDLETKRAQLEKLQSEGQKAPTVQTLKLSDGSEMAVQWNPQTRNWDPIQAPAGGGDITPKTKLTESQSKLTLFQNLQTESQPVLLDLESQFNPANMQDAAARSAPIGGNFFKSEQGQMYDAAATAWAEGALRIATGAAATPEEMERTKRAYFAQPGDTPMTIAFKAQMREMYNRSIEKALGSTSVEGALPKPSDFVKRFRVEDEQDDKAMVPDGIDPADWEFMTPEERALFR